MKHFKSVLAMLLALVMVLSCVGTAFAADKTEAVELTEKTKISDISKDNKEAKEEALKGFKSESFRMSNTYQYADDETVRAIVILEGEPEAEAGEVGSTKAADQRVKLVNQHNTVFKKMAGINYELKFEYTRLINGFSCDVAYGDLEAIAAIEGVEAVYIANSYAAPVLETPADTKQAYANEITDNSLMQSEYWDGYGTVVAVLDTGLNLEHEAFQDAAGWAEYYGKLTQEDVEAADLWVDGVYVSPKVPFAYDYADGDTDVTDAEGHGTHVSGTAVGMACTVAEDGESVNVTFAGAAPAAQLLSMKIFSDTSGGTTSDIYYYALEDAYALGADVVNMSIGAQNGFTYDDGLETEVFGNIYQRLSDAGIILSVAAGNEYSMAYFATMYEGYTGYIGSEYTDYGTVASPSTYEGNVSVASLENAAYPDYAVEIGSNVHIYADSCEDGEHGWLDTFGGTTQEYVMVTDAEGNFSLGAAADYANVDVTGKIAVVSRGDLSFEEKVEFAADAGAIGCIVVNNEAGLIYMSIETFEIPAISMQISALEDLKANTTLTINDGLTYVENPTGYLMSEFSNWGTTPMLTLDPSITSVGGMVYSSVPGGTDTYEVYSGTSMAAPNMSGTYANLLSAIYEYHADKGIEMSKSEVAELAKDLIHGSAYLYADENGYLYSPRKQGAGVATAYNAIWNYMESAYITNPLQELGDDPEKTGVYNLSVTLKNDSDYELYYTDFEAYVMYDAIANGGDEENIIPINLLASEYAYYVDSETSAYYEFTGADVTYSVDGVEVSELTIPSGTEVTVDVEITLDDDMKAFFDAYYPNGAFVEGYVVFNELYDGEYWSDTHATFLAYYGDWTQDSVLEEADFKDIVEAEYYLNTTVVDGDGNTYGAYGYTWYNSGMVSFYTNPNIAYITDSALTSAYAYAGDNMLGYVPYYEEHIAFSTPLFDGSYNYADAIYMEPYLLRNVTHLVMTVSNKETGEVYYVDDTEYLPKSVYDQTYGAWYATGAFMWDGTDAEGNYVPSGTVATITYDAVLPYNNAEQNAVWGFDVTVDYTAPIIEEVVFDAEAETLTVTASDENYLQGIYLANSYYEILMSEAFSSDVKGESFTVTFDVSGLIDEGYDTVYVTALDYATNENEEKTYLFEFDLPATLTFVTPYGSETVETVTGESHAVPAGPAVESTQFMWWTTEPVEEATEDDIWYVGGTWYFEGDEVLISRDITLYALYGVGETEYYEKPNYFYTQDANYNGKYALVGWNFDFVNGNYLVNDPIALSKDLTEVVVADLEDAEIGDYYTEFYTANTDICFTLTENEDGFYTIQAQDGSYMALVNGELVMVADPMEEALWDVYSNLFGNGTYIYNAVDSNMILLYDDDEQEFAVMDDSQLMDWALEMGYEMYPSEYYQLVTYKCVNSTVIVEYYTTELCVHAETEVRDAVEATCTEPGYTGDTYCAICGELVAEGEVIEALNHAETEIRGAVEPTCTKNGYTGDTYCVLCDELLAEGEIVPATGHNYVDGVCTECGAEDPDYSKPCYFNDFSDCEAEWYHEAVDFAVANGLMNGMGGDKFEPNTALSRAMVVTVLYRAAGEPEVAEPSTFTDVKTDVWYADPIAWAQDNGIVNGISATEFAPDENVTREQIATILWRYAGSPDASADLSAFGDADTVSGYAETAIAWAVAEGIMNGDGKNLNPLDNATRAEFACMIMRYLDGSYVCNE